MTPDKVLSASQKVGHIWSPELLGFLSFVRDLFSRKDRELVHSTAWGMTLNLEAASLPGGYYFISFFFNSMWILLSLLKGTL